MNPLRIYLDSSDLSVLSRQTDRTGDAAGIREQLKRWVDERRIMCCFSGIHLSEAAPLHPTYSDAAERRADLLVDLCGVNTLVSIDRLIRAEIRHAVGLERSLPDMYSGAGEWYPEGVADISPVSALALAKKLRDAIQELPANRKSRRLAAAKVLKHGRVRPAMQQYMVNCARESSLEEILEHYPMREGDARVLARYVVGDATKAEAESAFLASLQDPRWMMQWFERHHDRLEPFVEWARNPAKSVVEGFKPLAEHAARLYRDEEDAAASVAQELFSSSRWHAWQNDVVAGVVTAIGRRLGVSIPSDLSADIVDLRCPGLSTGVRSLHSAWRQSVARTPRSMRTSDFVDALHAMYAPYVDVFRADSFMAPIVSKFAGRFETLVIGRLTELPAAIERRIKAHSAS